MRLYLHSGLGQVGAHGQPLPHHHIRIVGFLEGLLQRLQLLRGEGRAAAALLAVLGAVPSLQDDVLECAAVGKEGNTRAKFISPPSPRARVCVCARVFSITSQPLGQGERVHGGPVVGRVLRLLRGLLVQVVHGAQGVHGVQRVAVHPVVLHGERPLDLQTEPLTVTRRVRDVTRILISGSRAGFRVRANVCYPLASNYRSVQSIYYPKGS